MSSPEAATPALPKALRETLYGLLTKSRGLPTQSRADKPCRDALAKGYAVITGDSVRLSVRGFYAWLAAAPAKELAERITLYLRRIERDPVRNPPLAERGGANAFYNAGASGVVARWRCGL